MNRKYTVESYYPVLDMLKIACPSLRIRTQIMVGFPSETEEDFQDALRVIDKDIFDFVEVYRFSSRINTPAANLPNKVAPHIVCHRNYCPESEIHHISPEYLARHSGEGRNPVFLIKFNQFWTPAFAGVTDLNLLRALIKVSTSYGFFNR